MKNPLEMLGNIIDDPERRQKIQLSAEYGEIMWRVEEALTNLISDGGQLSQKMHRRISELLHRRDAIREVYLKAEETPPKKGTDILTHVVQIITKL